MDYEQYQRKNPRIGEVTKEGHIIGRGERRRVVPPDEVYKLARLGCTLEEMADWFDVSRETLKYNFNKLILKAKSEIKQDLRRAQLRVALEGNPTMLIWLGKNMLGQGENPQPQNLEPLPFTDDDDAVTEPEIEEIDFGLPEAETTEQDAPEDAVSGTAQPTV